MDQTAAPKKQGNMRATLKINLNPWSSKLNLPL